MKKIIIVFIILLVCMCMVVSCEFTGSSVTTTEKHVHVVEKDVTVNPTCLTTGLTEGKHCAECHEVLEAQEIIPVIDCIESDWIVEKEATSTDEGRRYTICTMCKKIMSEEILLPTASVGLEFSLNPDGKSYSLKGIGTCTDTKIIIPEEYKNLPVTSIESNAFRNNQTITSVIIPDTVITIGYEAFWSCKALSEVVFGDSVTTIVDRAFFICIGLKHVTLGKSVESIGNDAFTSCTRLESMTMPQSVTFIGGFTFNMCISLQKINYEGTVEEFMNINTGVDWKDKGSDCVIYCTDGQINADDSVTYYDR